MASHSTNGPWRSGPGQPVWLPGPRHIGDVLDELRPLWVKPRARLIGQRRVHDPITANDLDLRAGLLNDNRNEYEA